MIISNFEIILLTYLLLMNYFIIFKIFEKKTLPFIIATSCILSFCYFLNYLINANSELTLTIRNYFFIFIFFMLYLNIKNFIKSLIPKKNIHLITDFNLTIDEIIDSSTLKDAFLYIIISILFFIMSYLDNFSISFDIYSILNVIFMIFVAFSLIMLSLSLYLIFFTIQKSIYFIYLKNILKNNISSFIFNENNVSKENLSFFKNCELSYIDFEKFKDFILKFYGYGYVINFEFSVSESFENLLINNHLDIFFLNKNLYSPLIVNISDLKFSVIEDVPFDTCKIIKKHKFTEIFDIEKNILDELENKIKLLSIVDY